MTLSPLEIRQVLDALQSSEWDEAVITIDDVTIAVARNGAELQVGTNGSNGATAPTTALAPSPPAAHPPQPAPASATEPAQQASAATAEAPSRAATAGTSDTDVVVTSPSVGVFWRSPQPGAPPFVEVGTKVEPGDTLCIVEVMKLMSNVVAEVAGTVTAIHVENAAQVEFGAPLVSIAPGPA